MRRLWIWLVIAAVLVALVGAFILRSRLNGTNSTVTPSQQVQGGGFAPIDVVDETETVQIRPAASIIEQVSASGNIALISQQYVVLEVLGRVQQIAVNPGDTVQAGDLLVALNSQELERAVRRAELSLESNKLQLDKLLKDADDAEIALAQANLQTAQENFADVQAGPSAEELSAAESNLASMQARYNDLLNGPSDAELVQLQANLKRTEVALADAQSAYNEIAWRNDVGLTPQSVQLQSATIDYEAARGAYEESITVSQSDLQGALSNMQDAQQRLNDLREQPTSAELATAAASVVEAQSTLDSLLDGAESEDIRSAEISVEQSLVELEQAYTNLAQGNVTAPIAGTVLEMNLEVGQQGSTGQVVAIIADLNQLELTIDVAEVDISQLSIGQQAEITIDAFPGEVFAGKVARIAPTSEATQGLVNYPVTVRLIEGEGNLDAVLPGMTAVARVLDTEAPDGWAVPTNALQPRDGERIVYVVRGEQAIPIAVTEGVVQGEWTIVQSADLQAGDFVVGTLASFIDQDAGGFGNGPPRGPDD
ncbi:MAG: efflux RND transporter periplasmic adaptor subunit [Chloroflexota bacterium]